MIATYAAAQAHESIAMENIVTVRSAFSYVTARGMFHIGAIVIEIRLRNMSFTRSWAFREIVIVTVKMSSRSMPLTMFSFSVLLFLIARSQAEYPADSLDAFAQVRVALASPSRET